MRTYISPSSLAVVVGSAVIVLGAVVIVVAAVVGRVAVAVVLVVVVVVAVAVSAMSSLVGSSVKPPRSQLSCQLYTTPWHSDAVNPSCELKGSVA